MAAKKTIGVLAAIITADAAALRKEFKGVDNTIRRSTTAWQKQLKGGLKLGAGIAGVQAGIGALAGEIQHVIANVERIPGINPQAVSTIIEARTEFAKFRNVIDAGLASVISFGATLAKAVGAGAALLSGASQDDISAGLTKLDTPDDIAAAQDAQFYDKVAAARTRLSEAQKKAAQAGMSDAQLITNLRAEAERYEKFAQSSSITTLQRFDAETSAAERTAAANDKLRAMKKDLAEAEKDLNASLFGAQRAHLTHAEAMEALRNKASRLQVEMRGLNDVLKATPDDPAAIAAMTQKTKELTQVNKELGKEYERNHEWVNDLGSSLGNAFENGIMQGEKLGDIVQDLGKEILGMFLKLAVVNPLLNGIFGGVSGWKALPAIFGFAEGGRPPLGRPSLVGENGPELFIPDNAGTIVPNHQLAGGRSGGTYYIDARGADRTGLARLEAMIRSLDGSIEPRAVAANMDYRRRGAAFA